MHPLSPQPYILSTWAGHGVGASPWSGRMGGLRVVAKHLRSSQAVFIYVVCLYFLVMVHQGEVRKGPQVEAKRKELNFILILCGGNQGKVSQSQGGKVASDIGRQIRQADVMLKSAVLLTKRKLHFHVIADSRQLYGRLVNRTANWPYSYRRRLRFSMHDVWYPEEREEMRSMFRVCATERLFVPDIFPDMDRAIYIDTDLIFMRPPEDLWSFFDSFSPVHVAAMAPCMYHYGSPRNKVPFYGETGLNAGIMHMDLDRMRAMPDGWTGATMAMHDKYKAKIKLADQDILNILFSFYPERLLELPCEWNYRVWLCSQDENKCPSAEQNGVSILHGNALAFVKGNEMKIQKVFESFEGFRLGEDSLAQLLGSLEAGLLQVDGEDLPSKCKAVLGIDNILLGELRKHVPPAP